MNTPFTEAELKKMGMSAAQIDAILNAQGEGRAREITTYGDGTVEEERPKVVQMHQHAVDVHMDTPLVPTSIAQIATYKNGTVVELPPFADGQPFVARMTRPSMLALTKSGQIPNSLLNQATSLFANGTGALNTNGRNATNVSDLFDVIDVIVEAALLEPTLKEIRSVGMELTDDQLMAIFSYTQRGVKALEQFRTE